MKIIDGKSLAASLLKEAAEKITKLNLKPRLDIIFVGDNPASSVYVKKKQQAGEKIGVEVNIHKLTDTTPDSLAEFTDELNAMHEVNGIIIQLPVPDFYPQKACGNISIAKDVDGLNPLSLGLLWQGEDVLIPATPAAVLESIRYVAGESDLNLREYLQGKTSVIINRSNILGKPLAALLLSNDSTVIMAHSKTKNIQDLTLNADIVVSATGQAGLITKSMVKPGAVLIDVGFSKSEKGFYGDVDREGLDSVEGWLSPVPGGIGPLGVAMLISNTVKAATTQLTS